MRLVSSTEQLLFVLVSIADSEELCVCVISVLPAFSAVQGGITPRAAIFVRLEISTSLARSFAHSLTMPVFHNCVVGSHDCRSLQV